MSLPPDHGYYKGRDLVSLAPQCILRAHIEPGSNSHECRNCLIPWLATFPWGLLCHWFSLLCVQRLTSPQQGTSIYQSPPCPSSEKDRQCLIFTFTPLLPSLICSYIIFSDRTFLTPPLKSDPLLIPRYPSPLLYLPFCHITHLSTFDTLYVYVFYLFVSVFPH